MPGEAVVGGAADEPRTSGGKACQLWPQFMQLTCRPFSPIEASGTW